MTRDVIDNTLLLLSAGCFHNGRQLKIDMKLLYKESRGTPKSDGSVVQGERRNTKSKKQTILELLPFAQTLTYTQKNVTIFGCKQLGYYAGGMMKTRVKNRRQKKLTNKTKARE